MITTDTKLSGPLFEPNLGPRLLAANLRAALEVAPKLGQALRAAYSGGIVRHGPGRYGHIGDQVRQVTQVAGDTVAVRVFAAGRAAFRAIFLEKGTVGHFIGARGFGTGRRQRPGQRRALKIPTGSGPIFRRYAHHPGAPAFHVAERTLEAQKAALLPIYQREIAKELGAT